MEENDASPGLAGASLRSLCFVQDRIGGENEGGRWVMVTTGELKLTGAGELKLLLSQGNTVSEPARMPRCAQEGKAERYCPLSLYCRGHEKSDALR